MAREPGVYYVRVAGCALFRVTSKAIDIAAAPGLRASTVRHLLLDQVLPLALAAEGHLVLHASGLRRRGCAIAVAGAAGTGKSTMAAALSGEGWSVTSDDGVLVEATLDRMNAAPAYPGLRLWPETLDVTGMRERCIGEVAEYSAKVRVAAPAHGECEAAPLTHVFVLERGERLQIHTLSARDAAMAVLAHAYRADLTDREALAMQLDLCGRFVERVPVSRLTLPDDLSRLRDAARALDAHATVGTQTRDA